MAFAHVRMTTPSGNDEQKSEGEVSNLIQGPIYYKSKKRST